MTTVRGARALTLVLLPFVGGCDFLTGVSEPEEVRVEIGSEDVSSVTLITSMHFLLIQNPECPDDPSCEPVPYLQTSDTSTVELPFDRTYRFTPRLQFFVETFPDTSVTATLTLRVSIDGDPWYDDFRELVADDGAGSQETLQFLYQFRDVTIDDLGG